MSFMLAICCMLMILGNSFCDLDTVTTIGHCNCLNTVGIKAQTIEELGQKLLQNIEPQLHKLQNEGDMLSTLDGMLQKKCQLMLPYMNDQKNVMGQTYSIQYGTFAQIVARICCELQQKHPTKRVTTTQQIYAVEARRIEHEFGGQANMVKMLDNVEQQIVGQLRNQEQQQQEGTGGKISDDWQDKLSEFVSKLEDKSLAQKLKMLMAGQKPSELLALGYELIMDTIHHHRRNKRNADQTIGWIIILVLCCIFPPFLIFFIGCVLVNIGIQGPR